MPKKTHQLRTGIDVLTRFRDALQKEIALIEKEESRGPTKPSKTYEHGIREPEAHGKGA